MKTYHNRLPDLAMGILEGNRNPDFIRAYAGIIEQATPIDIVVAVGIMAGVGKSMDELKRTVSRLINLLYVPLSGNKRAAMRAIPFIGIMME